MRGVPVTRVDAVVAASFALIVMLEHCLVPADPATASVWLGLVSLAPLLLRQAHPRAAFAVTAVVVLAPSLVTAYVPFFFGNMVALYVLLASVARICTSRRGNWLAGFGLLAGSVQSLHTAHFGVADVVFETLTFAAAWGAGRLVGRVESQRWELESALRALAAEQQLREETAAAAERSRAAAEAHDVLGHALSLLVIQVAATRVPLEKQGLPQPELAAIEELGRAALTELRRTIGVTRSLPVPTPGSRVHPPSLAEAT